MKRFLSFFKPLGIPIIKKELNTQPLSIVYASALLLTGCSSAEPVSSWADNRKLKKTFITNDIINITER